MRVLLADRDFIQWDTISLMSLLNVYVIFGYYVQAKKHRTRKDKITAQEFDNDYVIAKIDEIGKFFKANHFRNSHKALVLRVFDEASTDQFNVVIQKG